MKSLKIFASVALAISLSLSLTGCSEDNGTNPIDNEPHPGGSNSAALGPLGGSVSYGDVVIVFPAGALSTVEIVQLGIPATEPFYLLADSLTQIGYIYEANPADLQLNSPIPVAFIYEDPALEGAAETTLLLWSLEGDSSALTLLEDIYIDTAENVITGSTEQLGFFVLTVSSFAPLNLPPEAPALVAPFSGMQGGNPPITFWWDESQEVLHYHFQLAQDAAFNQVVYDDPGILGHMIGQSGLEQNQAYYWRVRGINAAGAGPWSEVRSFSVWDGVGALPLEGTWKLSYGYFELCPGSDDWIGIDIWSEAIVCIAQEVWRIEGFRWIHRNINGSIDSTYMDYLDLAGTYTLDNSTISLGNIIGDRFDDSQTAHVSIEQDLLTLTFEPRPYHFLWGYPMEGYLKFLRE